MGKGVNQAVPFTALCPAAEIAHLSERAIWLKVKGAKQQASTIDQHIWLVLETFSYLSSLVELAPGDLIYMGTPYRVGSVVADL